MACLHSFSSYQITLFLPIVTSSHFSLFYNVRNFEIPILLSSLALP